MLDAKMLKSDLVYAIKTLQKTGAILKVNSEEMEIIGGKYQLSSDEFDPIQALIMIKGWLPVAEHLTLVESTQSVSLEYQYFAKYMNDCDAMTFTNAQSRIDHLGKAPIVRDVNAPFGYHEHYYILALLTKETGIEAEQFHSMINGFDFAFQSSSDKFYTLGSYLREKFQPIDGRRELLLPSKYKAVA